MRLLTRSLITVSIVASALPAFADDHTFTGNVGLFSQYIFRGLTQTNEKPALQGGFDYAHKSGLYAGIWGSNVSWISDGAQSTGAGSVSASLELDTYVGYKNSFAGDWSYDVGYLRYNYPGSYPSGFTKPDTDELYGQLGWKWITLKYSHSISNKTFGIPSSKNTYYLDLTAAIPLSDTITLTLHGGRQKYKGSNAGTSNDVLSYTDYKVEVAKVFAKDWTVALGATDTNAKDSAYTVLGKNIGDNQAYVFLKKTF